MLSVKCIPFLAWTLQLALSVHCLCPVRSLNLGIKHPLVPRGFSRLLFYDDFGDRPAGSLPSSKKWTIDSGTSYPGGPRQWGTNEVQTYTSQRANIAVSNRSTLQITPVRSRNGSWTSARVETTADWDFGCERGKHVRVQARIKLGSAAEDRQIGIWPAFWALGSAFRGNFTNWPGIGEIDILESVNGESRVSHAVHCGIGKGGPCNEPSGISNTTEFVQRGVWHTYSWEMDRRARGNETEFMSWSVDDVRTWTLKQSDVGNDSVWNALAGGKKMLLLNVAVGGGFPDAVAGLETPTNTTVGGTGAGLEIDNVAVFA